MPLGVLSRTTTAKREIWRKCRCVGQITSRVEDLESVSKSRSELKRVDGQTALEQLEAQFAWSLVSRLSGGGRRRSGSL